MPPVGFEPTISAAADLRLRPRGHWDWHLCVRSYLKSVWRFNFLILFAYHPGALYLRQQGREDP